MSRKRKLKQTTVWKFGTNWAGNPNSFYDFIHDRGLVIGTSDEVPYKPGDIVVITQGYTVKALVQVEENPSSITKTPDFAASLVRFGIPAKEKRVTVAKAKWMELEQNERFKYRCQKGAVQVHHQATLDKVDRLRSKKKL